MDKKDQQKQKVKKFWRNSLTLIFGAIVSLGSLFFLLKEALQTLRKDTVPQNIVDITVEVNSLLESLEASQNSLAERTKNLEKIESIFINHNLDISRSWTSTLSHSLQLEQAFYNKKFSQNTLNNLIVNLDNSIFYSYQKTDSYLIKNTKIIYKVCDPFARLHACLGYTTTRSYLVKQLELENSSFLIKKNWQKINIEEIEIISDFLVKKLIKTFEIEILKNYNYNLTADLQTLTDEEKQEQLLQLSLLSALLAIVLTSFILLLIKQCSQGVSWKIISMYLLPEQCVGELETMYEILRSGENSICKIRLIMLWNILVLLKSLYIQVAIEDLFLSSKNKKD